MTIMELTPKFTQFISLTVMVFLVLGLPGCTEKPVLKPVASNKENKAATSSPTTENADSPPSPTGKSDADKQNAPGEPASSTSNGVDAAKDKEIQEFLTPSQPNRAFENPSTPAATETKPKSEPKEDENAKPDVKPDADEGTKEEPKQMTDEEIAAENAKRREETLKAVADKLGPPIVENLDKLTKAHPAYPVWIDKENKQVIVAGAVCQNNAPLEMFAVPSGTKEHEAIVAIPSEAFVVHAALMAIGAKPGKPAEFGPQASDYKPATGEPIDIVVKWKNEKGEVQTARAQEWIKNVKTGKDMEQSWVFGGSGFWKDDQTGIEYYKAEGGDFICVSNFPSAMLDLPIESSQSNDDLMFQANSERIPPLGTPVTVILTPKPKSDSNGESASKTVDPNSRIQEPEEEKLGIEPSDAKK
jgi:hypothetical protein